MKHYLIIILTIWLIGAAGSSMLACSHCHEKSKKQFNLLVWLGWVDKEEPCSYYRKTLKSIVKISNEKFNIYPDENKIQIAPLYMQIASIVPRRSKRYYRMLKDFNVDSQEIINLFNEKKEKTDGLQKFFDNYYNKIQEESTVTYIPMLILRAKDSNNKKVWIIHMHWEKNEIINADKSGNTVPKHLLSFAVDYNTGKILHEEK